MGIPVARSSGADGDPLQIQSVVTPAAVAVRSMIKINITFDNAEIERSRLMEPPATCHARGQD
jgi:hypothetical protein